MLLLLGPILPTRLQRLLSHRFMQKFFLHPLVLSQHHQSGFSDPLHLSHLYLTHCQSLGCSPCRSGSVQHVDAAGEGDWYCPPKELCACKGRALLGLWTLNTAGPTGLWALVEAVLMVVVLVLGQHDTESVHLAALVPGVRGWDEPGHPGCLECG